MAEKVKFKIDFNSLIESAFDSKKMRDKARGFISSTDFKREFGLRVIDAIITRTQDKNLDKNNNKLFKPYADSYINSDAFKVYGKTKNDINMTLTGEMLNSMDVVKISRSSIDIGFISKTQNDKAHGHINGIKRRFGQTKKKKGSIKLVIRDFFGLTQDAQIKILKSTMKDFNGNSVTLIDNASASDNATSTNDIQATVTVTRG